MRPRQKWEPTSRGSRLVRTEILGTTTPTTRGVNWKRADGGKGSAKTLRAARRAVESPAWAAVETAKATRKKMIKKPARSSAKKTKTKTSAPELTAASLYAMAKRLPPSAHFHSATFLGPLLERFGTTPQRARNVLFELYQNGEIELARADLVDAMPADLVRSSEIHHPSVSSARFHFLRPL